MLRVLVILPLYGGSLPVGRYAAAGLKECGCLVDTFEAPSFHSAFEALKGLRVGADKYEALQNSFLQVISQAIISKAESFAPDLVLCMAQAPMGPLALKRLRAAKIPMAMWFVEDYRLFTYWRVFAPLYDIFAVIQKDPFLSDLEAIHVQNPLYLPLAALPRVHRPLELTAQEKKEFGSELSFMGAGYPNRRKVFLDFLGMDFKIWGTEWEDEPRLAPLVQRKGARINTEDTVRIFNASAINLNLHSSVDPSELVAGGDFVNPRTFEIASCGAFQLVDRRSLMDELFTQEELARFSSMDELKEKITWYKERPEERENMAKRAQQRILAEHTYAARMRSLLDFAAERIPGFGQKKSVHWPANMPEESQKDITSLLESLQLPPTASFDEVTAALRSKAGKLTETETALLFLEEWKKLYLGK